MKMGKTSFSEGMKTRWTRQCTRKEPRVEEYEGNKILPMKRTRSVSLYFPIVWTSVMCSRRLFSCIFTDCLDYKKRFNGSGTHIRRGVQKRGNTVKKRMEKLRIHSSEGKKRSKWTLTSARHRSRALSVVRELMIAG